MNIADTISKIPMRAFSLLRFSSPAAIPPPKTETPVDPPSSKETEPVDVPHEDQNHVRRKKTRNGIKEKRDRNFLVDLPTIDSPIQRRKILSRMEEGVSLGSPSLRFKKPAVLSTSMPRDVEEEDFFSLMPKEEALSVISRLSLEDLFDATLVPKKWRALAVEDETCRNRLRSRCEKGLPPQFRGEMWSLLIKSTPMQHPRVQSYQELKTKPSPFSEQILRDVGRTFPNSFLFEFPEVKQTLYNILNANANYNQEVGYCQGMGLIAALMMFHMKEEEAFWAFAVLSEPLSDFAQLWKPELPGLAKSFYILNTLLKSEFPAVHEHLTKHQVEISSFATPWFITGFIHSFPLDLAVRLWDILLYEGFELTYVVSMCVFRLFKDKLLAMDFDAIVTFLNLKDFKPVVEMETLLKMVNETKGTMKPLIEKAEKEYIMTLRRNTM